MPLAHVALAVAALTGPVLRPSPGRFDSVNVANPVVLPPARAGGPYTMLYYGNDGLWPDGETKPFVPTGLCGLAESADGVSWHKVDGALPGGAVFGPSPDARAWDSLHVGVGDVTRAPDGSLTMYYFGGSGVAAEGIGERPIKGLRMCIGRASSADGGRSWTREPEPVLRPEPSEGLFCAWPRLIRLDGAAGRSMRMLYHAFDGSRWRVFAARTDDAGARWEREGCVLQPGPAGAFDALGIGTRAVLPDFPARGRLLLAFEGVDEQGAHRIGLADSADGGRSWARLPIGREPGGPALEPGGAAGAWTSCVVGTPWLTRSADGARVLLYHCAKSAPDGPMAIGCLAAPADGGVPQPGDWSPLCPPGDSDGSE